MIKMLQAVIVSLLISLIAHKIVAIPELYFMFGGLDAFVMMFIFGLVRDR